jgi:2-methylcitrate dehydratase PrpD
MPLSAWAARLAEIDPRRAPADSLGLHVADAMAALWAGRATKEGQALARVHGPGAELALMAGSIRLTEIDDIHLETCITPSSIVVPVALAVAKTPEALTRGLVAGYATLLRHGRSIGGAAVLAKGIWPTLVAAPLGAAATAATAMGLPPERTATALRLALLRSVGKIGHSPGALPARWFIFGECVTDGLRAAQAAAEGLIADPTLEKPLLAEGAAELFAAPVDHNEIDTISMKPFCTSRQAACGVVTFGRLMAEHKLDPTKIASVEVEVPSAYIGMLSRALDPGNRLSTLVNQGFQIAAAALAPDLLFDVGRAGPFPAEVIELAVRVRTTGTAEFDNDYPKRWPARVTVTMADGRKVVAKGVEIDGDPGAKLDLARIREKSPSTPMGVLKDAAAAPKDAAALRRLLSSSKHPAG